MLQTSLQRLVATVLLLACCLTALLPAAAAQHLSISSTGNEYIVFPNDSNVTCCCRNPINASEFDYLCEVVNKTNVGSSCSANQISCSELPWKIVYNLTINCPTFTDSVHVNLHALTKAHFNINSTDMQTFYPPQIVRLKNCRVDRSQLTFLKLQAENVSLDYGMEVAPFGSPDRPGVGGYYTINVTFPPHFSQSDCWLVDLEIDSADNFWFLPSYVTHKCERLQRVSISNTPIEWVAIRDIFSLRSVKYLKLHNCRLRDFANGALETAIDLLDRYLESGTQSGCINDTGTAIQSLKWIRSRTGRLNSPTFLYDAMATASIDFTLLFGHRSKDYSAVNATDPQCDMPHKMALTTLDLSFNELTEIPFSISMFDQLRKINLSHNKIDSLYNGWICWRSPIPDDTKSNSNRHCFWFRAARASLKVLDLSYNEIEQIGEIQPWHQVALEALNLRGNKIKKINFDPFTYSTLATSLLDLKLDNNLFTYFRLQGLKRLERLSLEHCRIRNIEPNSLPQSVTLGKINLGFNRISAIAPGVFKHLEGLGYISLLNNNLKQLYAESFVMCNRSTLGSRVELHIDNQSTVPICDCSHVYRKILQEEQCGYPKAKYTYPKLLEGDKNSLCQFFTRFNKSMVTKRLIEANQSEFLCEFKDSVSHRLPPSYCNDSDTTSGQDHCLVKCIPGCRCFHNEDWSLSNLDCASSNSTVNKMVRMKFEFPIKYMFMSGLEDSEFFRHVSDGSFKWVNVTHAAELLVLELNNSHVKFVDRNAFKKFPNIVQIFLHDNKISKIDASSFCDNANSSFNAKLSTISLHYNRLNSLDPKIINGSCLESLSDISLRGNPWRCSCNAEWIELHEALIGAFSSTQIVSDFDEMKCEVDKSIVDACAKIDQDEFWKNSCMNISRSNSYQVSDEGRLIRLCNRMADADAEKRRQIVLFTLVGAFGVVLLCLAILAVRRRHRLLAVVRVLILLRYQRDRQQQKQSSCDSLPYDAMMWASDSDQDCLIDVLNCVRSASGGDELELCVPESFLYSDLCSCPLTYFDCPAEGAKFSGKVVVALSERFLDTQYLALCQVIRELDSVGRNPFKDIVFLRLSSRKVLLQRERQAGQGTEDVEVFKTLQRILAGSDIAYKSVDWEYRLIERIRRRDSAALLVSNVPGTMESAESGIVLPAVSELSVLAELPTEERQPLVVDVEPYLDFMRSRIMSTIRDWPPFHSDKVSEVFLVSAPDTGSECRAEPALSSTTVVEQILRRLPGVRLGTNDAALAAKWPDNFEAVTSADRINSFMMKRTRQFVLLLNNGLLSWLRDELELQCEFQTFLAANSFRRRLLVIFIGQVDGRSRARYEALANQRLDGGESGLATNWFDITTEGFDIESLGCWLDCALYKRPG